MPIDLSIIFIWWKTFHLLWVAAGDFPIFSSWLLVLLFSHCRCPISELNGNLLQQEIGDDFASFSIVQFHHFSTFSISSRSCPLSSESNFSWVSLDHKVYWIVSVWFIRKMFISYLSIYLHICYLTRRWKFKLFIKTESIWKFKNYH